MSSDPDPTARTAAERPGPAEPLAGAPDRPIDSRQLLQGRREVVIVHRGQAYRLQETRAGKLILVK
jgi:hemin uptake protein HemP